MRTIWVLAGVVLVMTGCGAEPDVPEEGAAESTAPAEATEPGPADSETVLELNPTRPAPSAQPVPTRPSADPVGFAEALFAGQTDPGLEPLVTQAVTDLSARLGVEPSAITTVSSVLVTWPDAALGCPQPGMQYAQALQDGSLIELEHAGRVYRYHTGGSRIEPFLCDPPFAVAPSGNREQ